MRYQPREIGGELLRALILYAAYIMTSLSASSVFVLVGRGLVRSLHISSVPLYAASTLGIVLSIYSVARAFELYNLSARAEFISLMGEKYSLKRDIAISFISPKLRLFTLCHIGGCVLLAAVLPYQIGYSYLMAAVRSVLLLDGTELYFMKSAVVCPLIIVLMLLAKTSAHKWWIIARTAEREKLDAMKRPNMRLGLEVIKIFFVYTVSFVTLPTVIMLFVSLTLTVGLFSAQPWIIPAAVVIVLVPIAVRTLLVLRTRAKFFRRIKRSARECGYEISNVTSPVLSSLTDKEGATFTIKREDEVYTVKLLAARSRRRPLYINSKGFFTVKNTVSFLKITLFHIMTDVDYTFSGDGMKVAVFSPMPRRVFINWGRTDTAFDDGDGGSVPTIALVRAAAMSGGRGSGRSVHGPGYISDVDRGIIKPFETGERIGEYKFFTSAGFISAMENDCLKR